MSHSIHVATTRQVSYIGYVGAFDYEAADINSILNKLCDTAIFDDDDTDYAGGLSIDRKDLLTAADTIEKDIDKFRAEFEQRGVSFSPESLIVEMRKWTALSDQSNERVYLSWF